MPYRRISSMVETVLKDPLFLEMIFFYFLQFKIIYIADQGLVLSCDHAGRVDDGTGFIQFLLNITDDRIRILCDDRHLFQCLKMICEMIDDGSRHNVYQKT